MYKWGGLGLSWYLAQQRCQSKGSSLISITEQNFKHMLMIGVAVGLENSLFLFYRASLVYVGLTYKYVTKNLHNCASKESMLYFLGMPGIPTR